MAGWIDTELPIICVAGPELLQSLGLKRQNLIKCGKLRDVADRIIDVWGYCWCYIELEGRQSKHKIHFIPSSKRYILSLALCKELNLVHKEFPLQLQSVGAIAGNLHSGPLKVESNGLPEIHQSLSPPEKTNEITFTPLEENIARLEEWLL